MFSSPPQTSPLRSRARGIVLGTIIMVGVPIMVISAKTVQATLPILLVAASVGALAGGRSDLIKASLNAVTLSLFAYLGYAALSALWAPYPLASFLIALMGIIIAAGSLALVNLVYTERSEDALHMIEGLLIGLLVGLLYTIAEIASGQAIKMWAYNLLALSPNDLSPARYFTWENGRIIAIHRDDLSRNVVPIPLLIWPALMGATVLREQAWRRLVFAGTHCAGWHGNADCAERDGKGCGVRRLARVRVGALCTARDALRSITRVDRRLPRRHSGSAPGAQP